MARKKKDPCDELTAFAIAEYKAGRLPALVEPTALDGLAQAAVAEHKAGRTKPLREVAEPHRVKSFSLTEADLSFVESVAWSRQVSESAVVLWSLELLRELLDGV